MLTIKQYSVEELKDAFGILAGKRYEYVLDLDVPDDDELYTENGVYIKLVYMVDGDQARIVTYHIYESVTDQYLDYDLEPEELEQLMIFCKEHLPE